MNIGYACMALGVPNTNIRGCTLKSATPENLSEIIAHNLNALDTLVDYNIQNGIRLFRISSDLIPFASHPVNTLPWQQLFAPRFLAIGQKILGAVMRVSMHPGPYTVLNAQDENVAARAREDIAYHAAVLEALGLGSTHKIVLHIGGVYGDKAAALSCFASRFCSFDESIRQRLVIENDDTAFTIEDVLKTGLALGIPVVFDVLHHQILSQGDTDIAKWISACKETWRKADGPQKIHYSEQAAGKKTGSHSRTVHAEAFLDFVKDLPQNPPDIMLEVKDKNLSALKCINLVAGKCQISALEREWALYKYLVLEKSPETYGKIRNLLKDKFAYPALAFYQLVEHALEQETLRPNAINALEHVWGYFKDKATDAEKKRWLAILSRYASGTLSLSAAKACLYRLAEKYGILYLLSSYFFL